MVFAFVTTAAFSGNLRAVLLRPWPTQPINTLAEVVIISTLYIGNLFA